MGSVDQLFKDFNKQFKSEFCTKGAVTNYCQRIPFSSKGAEYLLYGGIPRGRITELAGEEGGGKTTLSLDVVSNAQKLFQLEFDEEIEKLSSIEKPTKQQTNRLLELRERGPLQVLWIDCENTFDEEWAGTLGVDVSNLYFMSPQSQSAEQIFEMASQIIDTGEIGLCVIDSLGMMVSQQAYDKSIEDKTYGGIAMALTVFSKKIEMICAKTNCALIGINQVRDNMNAGYGGPSTVTPGGRCWRHSCSVRLQLRKSEFFDEQYKKVKNSTENPYGHHIQISVVKTKICKPNRKLGSFTLVYESGIASLIDLVDLLLKYDLIVQGGAWFSFVNPETEEIYTDEEGATIKVQGQQNIPVFLTQNPDILERYNNFVDGKIQA